jgi:hypothetical protein
MASEKTNQGVCQLVEEMTNLAIKWKQHNLKEAKAKFKEVGKAELPDFFDRCILYRLSIIWAGHWRIK